LSPGGRCHLGGRHGGVARGRARGRANQAAQGGMGDTSMVNIQLLMVNNGLIIIMDTLLVNNFGTLFG
jgi:hypothetical protein